LRPSARYIPRREYRTEPSEDSDLIVALFRFAVIIAFSFSAGIGPTYTVQPPALIAGVVASVYTLLLMLGYLYSRQWLSQRRRQELAARVFWGWLLRRRIVIQRLSAIVVDLALLTCLIYDLKTVGELYLDFYFVVIGVAAIWFHREGGVIAALASTLCVTLLLILARGEEIDFYTLRVELPARAVMFLSAGLVTGYLARARDAERRQRERLDWELSVARQVQSGLLPARLPAPEGYDLGARFAPASMVGGDYYDALIGPDGRLFVLVADVAGKSVYAVMHLSLLRSALREAIIEGHTPREVVERVNGVLAAILAPNSFVSLFCAAIELPSGTVRFVNCGHSPPMLLPAQPDAQARLLFTGNIVLGVEGAATYDEIEERLEPGDCLLCCTDGVTEAVNARWQTFDTEGVVRAARSVDGASADAVAEAVLEAAGRHRVTPAADDATILVVRRTSPSP